MQRMCYLFLILLICSCSSYPDAIEEVLRQAGNNRKELEKVLKHYEKNPADSLKFRAAEFLIENTALHGFYSGVAVDRYYRKADSLFSLGIRFVPNLKEQLDNLFEETRKQSVRLVGDLQQIKASFLISQIDRAFATKKYPWHTRLSFEDFCEYILPYRIANEPLEDWTLTSNTHFAAMIDSCLNRGITSDSVICRQIVSTWPKRFRTITGPKYDLPLSILLKMEVGTCPDFAQLGVYVMRTFGIPVVYDFTPHWGNRSSGHDWNSLLYNGRAIPFQLGDNAVFGEHISKRADKLAKVYRKTFSPQPETLIMQRLEEDIPPLFRNPLIKDVSEMYFRPRDIEIELSVPAPAKKEIAYIMVFDNQQWVPIHWAQIKKNKAVFTRMAEECAYTVMYYHAGKFHPASQTLYIDTTGKVQ